MITGVQKAKKSSAASPPTPAWSNKPTPASIPAATQQPLSTLFAPVLTAEAEALLKNFTEAKAQPDHESALEALDTALSNKKTREAALSCLYALSKDAAFPKFEPYIVSHLPSLLEYLADKSTPVRESALAALKSLTTATCPYAVTTVVPLLFDGLSDERKWQTKAGTLELIVAMAKCDPEEITKLLPQIIPHVSGTMWDTKNEVKMAALSAMNELCAPNLIGNPDIENVVPEIVGSIANPERVPEVIKLLGLTTFVWRVEAPTLTIMVPLLIRALNDRSIPLRRKTGLIIDAMCKLVDNPSIVAPFLPALLPCLKKVEDQTSDPDCLEVLQKAHATLLRVGGVAPEAEGDIKEKNDDEKVLADQTASMTATLKPIVSSFAFVPKHYEPTIAYVASVCNSLVEAKNFSEKEWNRWVVPYMSTFLLPADAEKVCATFLQKCLEKYDAAQVSDEDEEGGEDLCNCRFGLAYGSKILLYRTTLHLIRGRRYGLCGANGAGKSTLMRAIAAGQVEGFPSADQVRTVYVEHDIDGSDADTSVLNFIVGAIDGVTKDEASTILRSVGFTDKGLDLPIQALSGGWKMKLALARAMLMKADIFLLDEPTNHLDSVNVAWLEDYLATKCPRVTSIIVSHDSGFLDNVCTDIIHYSNFQLKRYKGNLSEFVKKVPTAKSYYDLSSANQVYTFPKPGLLDGVKTQEKAILRMRNVSYSYPGAEKRQLNDISVQCSLGSRVAVLGPNGAGKSTLIKLMTGEIPPEEGTIWKHPNLRIAYVAQHAFHHIEQHLDMTPNKYIQWRYSNGEDIEEQEKVNRQVTEEDLARMKKAHMRPDGKAKVVNELLGRQKYKNSFQYEVSWVGYPATGKNKQTTWLPRETLEEMGLMPKVVEFDSRHAAEQSYSRPLNLKEVEKHLMDVGLAPEYGTHAMIRGLSGGQKVRLVIAAAMWNRPHMLVLDEPTNYLDRDSVAALAAGIRLFAGAVVMITHNEQFYKSLCTEMWHVNDGKLVPEGQKWGSTRNMAREDREIMEKEHENEEAATEAAKPKDTKIKTGKAGGRKALKDLERKKKLNHGVLIMKEHITGESLVPTNLGLAQRGN